ncbi:uncharacterized protein LOC132722673 [Ruditapes philippinarum]|uniref:uncharacterized protein LOC132722673 n=1 Tax=Ruditapes philippinarum TaxID=129788 RepID=UPI00295AE78F|nr:uncharacterized protein LOC132722673 [Ruditapes philippinarum]
MEWKNLSINFAVILIALSGLLVCQTAAIELGSGYDNVIELELLCNSRLPEHAFIRAFCEGQNSRMKRKGFAGLENLDLMSGIFSKLPMRSSAGISDMQALMREVGRKRK